MNTYDLLLRVTVVTLPDNQTMQTSYATTAATVTVTDQVGRQRRSEVDGLGRLIKVTEQDPIGRLPIYPSGKRVTVNRDTRGRLSGLDKVDSSGNLISRYINSVGYNVASQVTSIALANGVTENLDYSTNGRLQLARQRAMRGTTTLMDLNYSYGAASGESGAGTSAGNSVS